MADKTSNDLGTGSLVVEDWVLKIQDHMPDQMKNSAEWKKALSEGLGCGREKEKEQDRLNLILDWMWTKVLPELSAIAEEKGFGSEWQNMLKLKTADAAKVANLAADSAWVASWGYNAAVEDTVADPVYAAANAAANAFYVAAYPLYAANNAAWVAAIAANGAAGGNFVATSVYVANKNKYWTDINPIGLLEELNKI